MNLKDRWRWRGKAVRKVVTVDHILAPSRYVFEHEGRQARILRIEPSVLRGCHGYQYARAHTRYTHYLELL
jgi:hypothetical protein